MAFCQGLSDEVSGDWVKTTPSRYGPTPLARFLRRTESRLNSNAFSSRLASLTYSRVGSVREFRPPGEAEVRAVLAGWRPPGAAPPEDPPADPEGVAAPIRATGGDFRLPGRPLAQVGRILELNGLGAVSRGAVEAAREVLAIGAA